VLDPRLAFLLLVLGLPLCTAALRCFARWARGGSVGWLPLGVLALTVGIDGLRRLDQRAADAPVTWARGLVWGLLVLAGWAALRRVWRDLAAPLADEVHDPAGES
jgi:hypothetical protein